MVCGNCKFVGCANYTTDVTLVKCSITEEWYGLCDKCRCEEERQAKLNIGNNEYGSNYQTVEYSVGCGHCDADSTRNSVYNNLMTDFDGLVCTRCILCDAVISAGLGDRRVVCECCKKAIKFIRERFKEELV